MVTKSLGSTKIKLFPIGFGTGFSPVEYQDPKKIIQIIEQAIDLGINFLDSGENYGDGMAEKLLGQAANKNRKKVIIATKFSPEHAGEKDLIKSCEQSLKRLKTDYLDLYQFHWPNPKIPLEETITGLKKLHKQGKIRFIGAGNFSIGETREIGKLVGKDIFVSHQTELNINEQFALESGMVRFCNQNRFSLIAYSPLDQGRMGTLNKEQQRYIDKLSKKYSCNTNQLILNWLVSHKSVIPIPKTTNPDHLKENFSSVNFQITPSERDIISHLFSPKVSLILPSKISVATTGERGRGGYQTIQEALENKLNLVPGPKELAENLKEDKEFKPVRVVMLNKDNYSLINGRVRYWGWVIAFGDKKPIPVYIKQV